MNLKFLLIGKKEQLNGYFKLLKEKKVHQNSNFINSSFANSITTDYTKKFLHRKKVLKGNIDYNREMNYHIK